MKRILLLALFLLPLPLAAGEEFSAKLAKAALQRVQSKVVYDGSYYRIKYPMGDVPPGVGVCTDVVIRSYRALGIDLQERVHLDMKANFSLYPKNWGLNRPDANIDHRRVPNLRVFFKRFGQVLPITKKGGDYQPGDIVTWNLAPNGNLPHVGIVSEEKVFLGDRYKIVHNIGRGPKLEDMLFDYPITGHYRYQPEP